jgi:flavodoxin
MVMNSLVLFYSETGNTERIAKTIYNALPDEKRLINIKDLDINALNNCDLIFFGCPVHANSVPKAVKSFLKDLPDNLTSKIASFITYGVPDKAFYENCLSTLSKSFQKKSIEVLGEFHCLGKHSAIDTLAKFFPDKVNDAKKSDSHPDETDLKAAKKFALDIIKKCKK